MTTGEGHAGRGFTRIDMLAVIVVIAMLAAALLPAIHRARTNRNGTACLDNLRMLQLGWAMYSGDNDDRIVRSGGIDAPSKSMSDPVGLSADARSQWVLGTMDSVPAATNARLIQVGLLFPYVNSLAAYKCPSDRKLAGGVPTVRSMSMNCWLNPIRDWNGFMGYSGTNALRVFRKQADMTRPTPAECWVLVDENPVGINDGWFVCDPNTRGAWQDVPASYHRGAGGLSFADGHAELRQWHDRAVLRQAGSGAAKDPDATDLPWLQARSTSHR